MDQEDLIDDGCTGQEESVVEEANEIAAIIKRVVDSDGVDSAMVYDRYKAILHKYQEQSQLLDTFLEDIVVPLATLLRRRAVVDVAGQPGAADATLQTGNDPGLARIQDVCRLLTVLVTVRGYKTVVKFFPHEAADLEKVLAVLQRVRCAKAHTADEGIALWESQGILLLWLSILILIPFELATVDSTEQAQCSGPQPYPALVSKIMTLCRDYLRHPGGAREMAALLLGRLLTRPDMQGALSEFLAWSATAVRQAEQTQHEPFLVPGVLQTLSSVFKLGQRQRLLPHAPIVWAQASALLGAAQGPVATNALARKLAIKLTQRLGLTFLEPRLAPWRYLKDDTSLDSTLAAAEGPGGSTALGPRLDAADEATGGDEADFEVAEEVEDVIECLLGALRDKDTIVRWSAAKGMGRITGCLPKELGDEIVASVLVLFKPTETDTAWHGGCLALAELARRGLLLPGRLPAIVPLIRDALHYDVRRGPHSVGAHVRDAAAYVCWAFARAYAPEVLGDSVTVLAASLLTVACYDREVNCRRAAAAAFQEAVGRLGNFPHGMDILHVADYFAVGNINQAYLKVAPFIAGYPEYQTPLATHLLSAKLRHWDKALRELAAQALAPLVSSAPEFFATDALDELLPLCLDPVLEVRHGAVLGVAALLPALRAVGQTLEGARRTKVANIVPAIDKARLYRGKGGEMLREAVGRLVEAGAVSGLPLSRQQHTKALEALDENLRHPQAAVQAAAVAALRQYASAYAPAGGEALAALQTNLRRYAAHLLDPNVAVRRGYSLALGALPSELLRPVAEQVLKALSNASALEEDVDQRDVESRVNAIRAAGQLCVTLFGGSTAAGRVSVEPDDDGVAAVTALLGSSGSAGNSNGCAVNCAPVAVTRSPLSAEVVGQDKDGADLMLKLGTPHGEAAAGSGPVHRVEGRGRVPVSIATDTAPMQCTRPRPVAVLPEVVRLTTHCTHATKPILASQRVGGAAAAAAGIPVPSLPPSCWLLRTEVHASASRQGEPGPCHTLLPGPTRASVPAQCLGTCHRCPCFLDIAGANMWQTAEAACAKQFLVGPACAIAIVNGALSLLCTPAQLLPVLCTAMQDYTTDNRGDVGSWVREAAMGVLTGLVPLVARCLPSSDEQRLQDVVALVAGILLKQAVERIARVREAAIRHLQQLLEQPAVGMQLPSRKLLAAAMPHDSVELTGVASLEAVPRLAELLTVPQYTAPLLEGLTASIGGMDASLSRTASSALCSLIARSSAAGGGASDGTANVASNGNAANVAAADRATAADGGLLMPIAQYLINIWGVHAKSSRMATPLLRTAHLLVSRFPEILSQQVTAPHTPAATPAAMDPTGNSTTASAMPATLPAAGTPAPKQATSTPGRMDAASASGVPPLAGHVTPTASEPLRKSFADQLVELTRAETRQCSDVPRLLDAAALLCQLVAAQEPCCSSALQGLCVLLVSRYPRVRRHAAEQLYLQLLSSDDGGDEARAQAQEAASDLLLATTWDGGLDEARAARDQLAATLGVMLPKMVVRGAGVGGAQVKVDAHSSYQSLLDDAARGY